MLGLRTRDGLPLPLLQGREQALERLVRGGFLEVRAGRVCATQQGADLLNAVILELVSPPAGP